ncbi:MAG: response regulator [Bacteroidota bacterium]
MKKKILCIDDEPTIRLLLRGYLTTLQYEIECSEDGQKALEWLERNLPDLVICDIQMPLIDGFQFLDHLRNRSYTKHTPVIMLSGVEGSKERVKCYEAGAQDFLAKPFNPEELAALIHKNLNPLHLT